MGTSNGKRQLSTYIPSDLHQLLRVRSVEAGIPVSVIVEDLIREHLDDYLERKAAEKARSNQV